MASATTAIAAPVAIAPSSESIGFEKMQPRVNWTGSAYITPYSWSNITSSNNLFADSPRVTNAAGNPANLIVRIVNSKGEVVGSEKTVEVGKSVVMDQIPAFSGTYTLQGKSTWSAGTFTISID